MPDAIQVLEQEHRTIEQMIARAQDAGERLERGEPVHPQALRDILDFFRTFVNGWHHRKEQDVLFPALAAKSRLVKDALVQMLLDEQKAGQGFVEDAAQLLSKDAAGAGRMLLAYAKLLRKHISREEVVLFRRARSLLSEPELRDMQQRFECLDRSDQRLPRAA